MKIRGLKINKFVLMTLLFHLPACAVSQKEFRAYTGNFPDWKLVEKCGYQHCDPKVDYLISKDMTIRLEFDNDQKANRFFVIRTWFNSVTNQVEYIPSNISVRIGNGAILKPKVFNCSYTIWELNYFRSKEGLQGSVPVNKNPCYLLFFDHPGFSKEDKAEMNLGEALTINGKGIDVPLVQFRKNPIIE